MLKIYQYDDGYRYNSDSLLLYDFISTCKPKGNLLDVGSGSGIVGLLLKRDFLDIHLTQLELQKRHFILNKKNAEVNELDSNIINANFLEYSFDKKYDFIVSNPPFYKEGTKQSENESLRLSRYNDALPIEKFVKKASSIAKPRGSFIICYDAKQVDIVLASLAHNKFKVETLQFVQTKENKSSHLFFVNAKKSSKALVNVLQPLVIHDNKGEFTSKVKQIYKKSLTKSYSWRD